MLGEPPAFFYFYGLGGWGDHPYQNEIYRERCRVADGSASVEGASTIAADRLRSFIERVERLEEEKAAIMNDVKEIYAEAKGDGYDVKTLRQVVRIRKMDRADRQEQEALLELYLSAIGEG